MRERGGARGRPRGERSEVFSRLGCCFSSRRGASRLSGTSVGETRAGRGARGTLNKFVFLHKHSVFVFAFEVLYTFNCTIVFTCREDYKRLQSSLLSKNTR